MSKEKTRQRVHAHREALRRQGLRPLQIWVPDTRSVEFAAEARRQCRLVGSSAHAEEDQAWVDEMSSWSEDSDA